MTDRVREFLDLVSGISQTVVTLRKAGVSFMQAFADEALTAQHDLMWESFENLDESEIEYFAHLASGIDAVEKVGALALIRQRMAKHG